MPYESWVERQIREATERGEFDNLPGAGRPLPGLNGRDDENWWIKGFLEREKIPMPLPASLALRKEVTDLPETLAGIHSEAEVRRLVEDLNERIRDSHRRRIDGPALVLRPVDVEATVAEWRRNRMR
jgi:DnaJ-like protein